MKYFLFLFILATMIACNPEPECTFYDGNGEELPTEIVELLIKDQFTILSAEEERELNYYFD